VTRLSREQVAAAAALLADLEAAPLFALVRAAVLERAWGGGEPGAGGPAGAAGEAGEAGEASAGEAEGLAASETTLAADCGHGELACVRVQTAHVLTLLLLTEFGGGAAPIAAGAGAGAGSTGETESEAALALRGLAAASLRAASPLVAAEVALLRSQVAGAAAV